GPGGGVPSGAIVGHRQAAELRYDIVTALELGDVPLPFLEDRVAPIGPASDADRRTEMVEDHHRVGDCACQCEELTILIVVVPGVVGQTPGTESRDSGAERRVLEQAGGRAAFDHQSVSGFRAHERVTNATEQSSTRRFMRVEDVVEVPRPQIGAADDAGDQAAAALRLGGDELRL